MARRPLLALALLVSVVATAAENNGCSDACPEPPIAPTATGYPVHATETPEGRYVDGADPAVVDCLADRVDACLSALPPSAWDAAGCVGDIPTAESIAARPTACSITRVATDWLTSRDGTQELLRDVAPQAACDAKNLSPSDGYACHWRVAYQSPYTEVVPPSLYLWPAGYALLSTACVDPWASPEVAACVVPTWDPMGSPECAT